MGSARWSPSDWDTHQTRTVHKSAAQIFTQSSIVNALDPKNIKFRESVDSKENPESTPIIIGVDVTGSMGILAEQIVKSELGKIMKEIYDRKPVTDPHIAVMAIGDSKPGVDVSPLQVTQFEADIRIADQMADIYIEGGGGGNRGESYALAWYFAAFKVKADAITKRGRKGYLFTIGDEPPHLHLRRDEVERVFGERPEADLDAKDLIGILTPNWEVFHLIVKPGSYADAPRRFKALLGEHVLMVDDYTKLGEVIVSAIQIVEGETADTVAKSWSGTTAVTVAKATRGLTAKAKAGAGVARL